MAKETKETKQKITRWTRTATKYLEKSQKNDGYEDIVDRTNFRTTAETKRSMQIAEGKIGAGDKGLYDYEIGQEVPKEGRITDVELLIRNNKLDKADIQTLKKIYEEKANKTINEQQTQKKLEAEEKANKNRTEALDKILGTNNNESQD